MHYYFEFIDAISEIYFCARSICSASSSCDRPIKALMIYEDADRLELEGDENIKATEKKSKKRKKHIAMQQPMAKEIKSLLRNFHFVIPMVGQL